jgi:CBS domain-containing membrane protein
MRHRTTTVEEVMSTALLTVKPDESIDSADLEMKLAEVRHFPVIDSRNRLVGIVSNRDLLRARAGAKNRTIADIMSRRVQTVMATEPASRAAEILLEHRIGCVPVLGDDGHLVGIVTETDFLRIAHDALLRAG